MAKKAKTIVRMQTPVWQGLLLPSILSAIIVLFPISPVMNAADKSADKSLDFIQEAEDKFDLFALPSFVMKAKVQIEDEQKMLEGTYLLVWAGPDKWHEEIFLPGYFEIRVGKDRLVYLKRSTAFPPLRVQQLHAALGYGAGVSGVYEFFNLGPHKNEQVKRVYTEKKKGISLKCAEIENKSEGSEMTREICIDQSTGFLVRQRETDDRDIAPVGEKFFPRHLSFINNAQKTVAEIEINDINTTSQIPDSAFEPPVGASAKGGCMNPLPPQIVKQTRPSYPVADHLARTQGTVDIYAVIRIDGTIQIKQLVSKVSPGLDQMSIDTVSQWRYEPAKCGNVPVEIEMLISVTYVMGH